MPSKCYVPGCKSNYNSTRGYVSVFQFPRNAEMREKWIKYIHRKDFVPTNASVVCIKHFRQCDVIISDTYTDKSGVTHVLPRKCPALKPNAYPSLFPDLPSNLPVDIHQPCKNQEERASEIVIKQEEKINDSLESFSSDVTQNYHTLQSQITMENKQADSEILKQEVETTQSTRNTETNISCLVVGIKQELDLETNDNTQSQPQILQEKIKQEEMYIKSEEISVSEGVSMKTRNVDSFNDTMTGPVKAENPDYCEEDVWRHIKDEMRASTWSYFTDSHADVEIMESSNSDLHLQHIRHDIVLEKLPDNIRSTVKTTQNVGEGLERQIVKQMRKNTTDVIDELRGLPEHIHNEKNTEDEAVSFEMMQVHKDNTIMTTESKARDLSLTSREQRLNEPVQRLYETLKVTKYNEILVDNMTQMIYNDSLSSDNEDCRNVSENVFCVSKKDTEHNVTSVSSDTIYRCDVCEVVFITFDSLSNHKKEHKVEKPYKCDICGKGFTQTSSLNTHTKIHTGEKPYKCDVCDKGFTRKGVLKEHQKIHTGEKPHKCDVCGKGFTQPSRLNAHTKIHTGEKPYRCDICYKGFSQSTNLKKHQKIHTEEKPHICDFCDKGFIEICDLKKHTKIHTGEKPYMCDVCGERFARADYFNIHKRKHTGEKPYMCDFCGKGFHHKGSFNTHTKKHTGEKPYKCDVCGKGFTYKCILNAHAQKHTAEKPYKSDVCGKGFAKSANLNGHKIIHTGEKPYMCNLCGKGFTHPSSLSSHKKIHTGQRPYKCDVCFKDFIQSTSLRSHKMIHAGQKPYKCNFCGKGFTKNRYLNAHRITHTVEKL